MLFRHGHIEEAIPFFDKAASLMESDWHNPLMLVTCHNSTGNKAELNKAARIGLDRAEKAIAKDPTNGGALAAGANALRSLAKTTGRWSGYVARCSSIRIITSCATISAACSSRRSVRSTKPQNL